MQYDMICTTYIQDTTNHKHLHLPSYDSYDILEQPPLFGKERNSLWMETFFFQIHLAYGNEVGGN